MTLDPQGDRARQRRAQQQRGRCPVCGGSVRLDVDGRVTAHPYPGYVVDVDDLDAAIPGNCAGVGYLGAPRD